MSIQPVVGLPGAYPPKLSTRREIFLHPDKVSYRQSNRFLHKHAKDWEDSESPNTLKAGTLLALRKTRFQGESQAKLYWFPLILTANHQSAANKLLLPESFKKYSNMFSGNCKFTRIRLDTTNGTLSYTTVTSNGTVNTTSTNLEINFDAGAGISDANWANASLLAFWGVEGGPPNGTGNPFDYIVAFSVLPGDTLVSEEHTQLHHYPWSGIVKGDMIYPRCTLTSDSTNRNNALKRIVKAFAAAGLSGLLVDEATFE